MRYGHVTRRANGRMAIPVRHDGMSLTIVPKPHVRPYGWQSTLRVSDLFEEELVILAANAFQPYHQK